MNNFYEHHMFCIFLIAFGMFQKSIQYMKIQIKTIAYRNDFSFNSIEKLLETVWLIYMDAHWPRYIINNIHFDSMVI